MDWSVKYHPKSFDEVVGNKETIQAIKKFIEKGNIPHMLFYGRAGTGKTTIAELTARAILGDDFATNYKEMNASDDRTIDIVRKQIIPYMRYRGFSGKFKILFLDEADAITVDAQQALKRPLELYKHNCRVIFACNHVDKIIPEIRDRCVEFKFTPLSKSDIIKRLKYITEQEGITKDINYDEIYELSGGSMRKAILLLQQQAMTSESRIDEILKAYLG